MSDNMKFVILGAGNIGTLIGAKLAQLDDSEVLIHGRGEHAARPNQLTSPDKAGCRKYVSFELRKGMNACFWPRALKTSVKQLSDLLMLTASARRCPSAPDRLMRSDLYSSCVELSLNSVGHSGAYAYVHEHACALLSSALKTYPARSQRWRVPTIFAPSSSFVPVK